MTVITLDGPTGGGARLLGPEVAQVLELDYVDRTILHTAAQHIGASVGALHQKEDRLPGRGERFARFLQTMMERSAMLDEGLDPVSGGVISPFFIEEYDAVQHWAITEAHQLADGKYMEVLERVMRDLVAKDNVVIVGRGGPMILRDLTGVLRVGVVANWWDCVTRIMERECLERVEAEKVVRERDRARAYYFKRFFGVDDPDKPELYHLVINTSDLPPQFAVETIIRAAKVLEKNSLPNGASSEISGLPS